jgi:DNA repair protein RadC
MAPLHPKFMTHSIFDIPATERPRERLKLLGANALNAEELLAIILGSGSRKEPVLKLARELLMRFQCLQGVAEASIEELQTISGIGIAKALQLKAAFSLAERCFRDKLQAEQEVKSPEQVFNVALPYITGEKRELFLILLLNVKSRLIGVEIVSIGTLSATLVHPREVFYQAIRRKASALIAVHNHPSGDLRPSREDIELTQHLIEASHFIEIPLLDHLIISTNKYNSLREQGIHFPHSQKGARYVCDYCTSKWHTATHFSATA